MDWDSTTNSSMAAAQGEAMDAAAGALKDLRQARQCVGPSGWLLKPN